LKDSVVKVITCRGDQASNNYLLVLQTGLFREFRHVAVFGCASKAFSVLSFAVVTVFQTRSFDIRQSLDDRHPAAKITCMPAQ
jgi:hypothetical protein